MVMSGSTFFSIKGWIISVVSSGLFMYEQALIALFSVFASSSATLSSAAFWRLLTLNKSGFLLKLAQLMMLCH